MRVCVFVLVFVLLAYTARGLPISTTSQTRTSTSLSGFSKCCISIRTTYSRYAYNGLVFVMAALVFAMAALVFVMAGLVLVMAGLVFVMAALVLVMAAYIPHSR
jgi:hypothetical protein